jgi:hypothetical protein
VALARSRTTAWKLLSYRVIGFVFAVEATADPSHISLPESGALQTQDDPRDNSTPSQLGKPLMTAENGGQYLVTRITGRVPAMHLWQRIVK